MCSLSKRIKFESFVSKYSFNSFIKSFTCISFFISVVNFELRKYIPPELKQSYIIAVYDIALQDINKKIQILNCDEKINKKELENICNIYLDNKKIEFNLEYTFNKPRTYTFTFEFNELLTNAKIYFMLMIV